jgi:hypothetical protein
MEELMMILFQEMGAGFMKQSLLFRIVLLLFIGTITFGIFASPIPAIAGAGNVDGLKSSSKASFTVTIYNEIIVMPLQQGWVRFPAHRADNGNHFIVELLPEGQTLDKWEELLAIQGFRGKKYTIYQMLELLKQMFRRISQEQFVYYPGKEGKVDGHNFISAIIGCAGLKQDHPSGLRTNEGEFGYYMVIEGKKDIYVVYHAWRGAAYERNHYPVAGRKVREWAGHMEKMRFIDNNR